MTRISAWILAFTKGIGGTGMFVIAFLDSSFLSFPVVTDATIVSMVAAHRESVLLYAAMATLGSVAGCVVLYLIAKKSGETFLRKRFHAGRIEWASGLIRRYGALAVIVPALLPPPAPFKLFVLLAGLADVPLATFVASIVFGRGLRYFGEAILALLWGEAAFNYLRQNAAVVGFTLVMFAVLAVAAYFWRQSRQPRPA
jgi:membrane protein YqaA with SNARE-associated domain